MRHYELIITIGIIITKFTVLVNGVLVVIHVSDNSDVAPDIGVAVTDDSTGTAT